MNIPVVCCTVYQENPSESFGTSRLCTDGCLVGDRGFASGEVYLREPGHDDHVPSRSKRFLTLWRGDLPSPFCSDFRAFLGGGRADPSFLRVRTALIVGGGDGMGKLDDIATNVRPM